MPSNEERREVAARLRSVEADAYSCCETYYDALRDAVGCGYGQDRQYMDFGDRLADLIEPDERTCGLRSRFTGAFCYECTECGHGMKPGWNFCPSCGARVIGG